jgi:hypothetical protein
MAIFLGAFHSFGKAEAGMSDGPVHTPSANSLIPWLICSYFFISALGLPFAKNRKALWVVAGISYAMLFIAYCTICSEASGRNAISAIIRIGLLAMVVFLPWHAIWFRLLSKKSGGEAG